MIEAKEFLRELHRMGSSLITGVPDSLMKGLLMEVESEISPLHHQRAPNEGSAIAIASGAYLATGLPQVVYLQNSGLGNCVNPLMSLAHNKVYATPMLLLIGWRGKPGVKDEPQHIIQGSITEDQLTLMGINYAVLDAKYEQQLERAYRTMSDSNQPYALLIDRDSFRTTGYDISNNFSLSRKEALSFLLQSLDKSSMIVSTTGKTSRELYYLREELGMGHDNDFLMVGSMGHTASLALGISLASNKQIIVVDGDGSMMMHLGGVYNLANAQKENLKYLLINNESHQSVGGQKSLIHGYDEVRLLNGIGFNDAYVCDDLDSLEKNFPDFLSKKNTALVVRVSNDSDESLGRPKESSIDSKKRFMEVLANK